MVFSNMHSIKAPLFSFLALVVLAGGLFLAVGTSQQQQDTRSRAESSGPLGNCANLFGGQCKYTSEGCAGGFVDNYCPAPSNYKCCMPTTTACYTQKLGKCQTRGGSQGCSTEYASNFCPGPDAIKCCINQRSEEPPPPPPPPANQGPTANAGGDKEITLPTNIVTFAGSGTDPDGTISTYSWTRKEGGPTTGGTIATPNAATTAITGLVEGVYEFNLEVTDNKGAKASDVVKVTVNRAPNVGPSANAGPDKMFNLPTDSVKLTGSGTDTDGTISEYTWTKTSGPDYGYIESPYTAETLVSSLVVGEYEFKLEVVDNDGVHAFDTVKVTVKPAVPTNFIFDVFMHGIGKSGDNSNPTGGGGNMNLLHFQRQLMIEVYNTQNELVKTDEGVLLFNSTSGSFKGKIDLGIDLLSGPYTVKVKMKQSLKGQIPGIQIVTAGVDKVMPTITLMTGDVNGDNALNILDYDIIDGCFSDLLPAENCTAEKKLQADITDDGFVNQLDYALFVRELSNIGGQ